MAAPAVGLDVDPKSGVFTHRLRVESVPRLVLSAAEVRALPLDHRAGFIMWLIDGRSSVEDVLDGCAMPMDEAIAILRALAAMGVIAFD